MVSISLIAIVFVTLFRMQSGIVRLSRSSEFYTIAPVLARQVLDNMDQDIVETGEVSGRFEEDAPGYEWHLRVHDTMAEDIEFISQDNLESFKKIEVNITGPKETETFVVTTWRFFP